jgi:hypothetical protein
LCHWLAYKEEFIIKWQQVVRTCLNIKKSFKKCYEIKIKVEMNVFFGGSLQLGEYFQKMTKKSKFCDLEKFFCHFLK